MPKLKGQLSKVLMRTLLAPEKGHSPEMTEGTYKNGKETFVGKINGAPIIF